MEKPPGGHAAAEADQANGFIAETVAPRNAWARVCIALGVGILWGGIIFADKYTGHSNDMRDTIRIGFGAAGLAFFGVGIWWLRRNASPPPIAAAAGGAAAGAADTAALTPAPAAQPGPGTPARTPGRGPGWVDDKSGAITIAERYPRWIAIVGTIVFGVLAVSGPLNKYPNWAKHMPAVIAYLILVAAVLIVGCLRGWRMGLSMDNHGVTIRNYFRTYRAGWGEVSRFTDGAVNTGANGPQWALRVILQGGRAITACGTWKNGPTRNETLSAIRQGAGGYGVPANVTGVRGGRGGRLTAIAVVLIVAFASWTGANLTG